MCLWLKMGNISVCRDQKPFLSDNNDYVILFKCSRTLAIKPFCWPLAVIIKCHLNEKNEQNLEKWWAIRHFQIKKENAYNLDVNFDTWIDIVSQWTLVCVRVNTSSITYFWLSNIRFEILNAFSMIWSKSDKSNVFNQKKIYGRLIWIKKQIVTTVFPSSWHSSWFSYVKSYVDVNQLKKKSWMTKVKKKDTGQHFGFLTVIWK